MAASGTGRAGRVGRFQHDDGINGRGGSNAQRRAKSVSGVVLAGFGRRRKTTANSGLGSVIGDRSAAVLVGIARFTRDRAARPTDGSGRGQLCRLGGDFLASLGDRGWGRFLATRGAQLRRDPQARQGRRRHRDSARYCKGRKPHGIAHRGNHSGHVVFATIHVVPPNEFVYRVSPGLMDEW